MGWFERQAFFERIVALRDDYATSGEDRRSVLSIADAVRYVEAIMTAVELDIDPWLAELDEAFARDAADGTIHPSRGGRFASDLWSRPHRSSRSVDRRPEIDQA